MSLTKKVLHKKHLDKCANGGGGVSSWNDLTDKPFGEALVEKEYIFERGNVTKLNGTNGYILTCDAFDGNDLVAGQKYAIYYAQYFKGDSTVWEEYASVNNDDFIAEIDENGNVYLGSSNLNGNYPFYFSSENCAVNYIWVNQFTYAQAVKLVGAFGGIKKIDEKYLPQAQADWDETDETSPAFIMNKPENLGGYVYYYINMYAGGSGVLRSTNEAFDDWSDKVETGEEIYNTYLTKPIMLRIRSSVDDTTVPCIGYMLSNNYLYLNCLCNGQLDSINTKLTLSLPSYNYTEPTVS